MTKTQLMSFVAVARERSFTKAANALYISQPSISKNVAAIEEELGARLLERRGNSLGLTAAGALLYDFFEQTEENFKNLRCEIDRVKGENEKPVKIGCPDTWNPAFFYEKLQDYFSARHMGMSIENRKLSELIMQLKSGELDFVLTHDFYAPSMYGIRSEQILSTGFGVLYSPRFFAAEPEIKDFKNSVFLLYDDDIQKRIEGVIREMCLGLFTPKIRNVGRLSSALFDVACGKGVMLFSEWDSVVSNSAYGFVSLNRSLPVNLLYSTERGGSRAEELVKDIKRLFEK